ncbi:hypothetical protein EK21DRAFT_66914 [Setomelanomma holmii]|uniref:Uncharacterized protein n=1 Tax=Setomelanomma holmii TaxID=210430 RepID=A0A9P4LMK7_9PLEO|nr:hypothetical protein EK21DRAFT_66914 [Setomelanomma holmii]
MPRKAGNGKLPRASLTVERPQQNLARQRNIYELPESPEKHVFRLPATVNQQPVKVVRKRRVADAHPSDSQVASSELPRPESHDDIEKEATTPESPLPSSPPKIGQGSDGTVIREDQGHEQSRPQDVHVEEQLPNGAPRCTMVSYKSTKPQGPRYEQCHKAGTKNTEHGLRCHIHHRKLASTRCQYMVHHAGDIAQCRAPSLEGSAHCSSHAANGRLGDGGAQDIDQNARQGVKRKSESHHDDGGQPTRSTKKQIRAAPTSARGGRARRPGTRTSDGVQASVSRSQIQRATRQQHAITEPRRVPEEHVASSRSPAGTRAASGRRTQRNNQHVKQSTTSAESSSKQHAWARRSTQPPVGSQRESSGTSQVDDDDAESAQASRATNRTTQSPGDLDDIFQFLELEERTGSCETDLGVSIKRICDNTHNLLLDADLTSEEIGENVEHVREVLKRVAESSEQDHRSLKSDIYAYGFRSLAEVLQSLHRCLATSTGDMTTSLEALRLLVPLIRDILALKDTVASWKVAVPQRYKGDRIIKDVDSELIAPLRAVERTFSKRLALIESREQSRQKLDHIQIKQEEEEHELLRQADILAAKTERWKRWQELHIKRMQCESNPHRRKRLVIKREDLEEKDANGLQFERLPVFKSRTTPPLRWASSVTEEVQWSDEQQTALLDGLQTFAGPRVFHDIFETYCRSRGPLRDFTVLEIVAKANWVRSTYAKLQQESGWGVPPWVQSIPTLP